MNTQMAFIVPGNRRKPVNMKYQPVKFAMSASIHILIIEDDIFDAEYLNRALNSSLDDYLEMSYHIEIKQGFLEGLSALNDNQFDLILLDLNLPDAPDIQQSLQDFRHQYPGIPLIVMTGLKDKENALQSLRNGAQDYLIKGETTPMELRRSITYAIERHRLKLKLEKTISELDQKSSILHSILNHMGDGVVVMNQNAKLTMLNEAAAQMLNISWNTDNFEHWLGHHGTQNIGSDQTSPLPELPVSEALQGVPVDGKEITIISPKYAEERYISVTARPIDEQNHSLKGCVAVLHDITQRKKVEKMKDEFVSTVSHELRTPLTSISGSLALIAGGVVGGLPEKAVEMIHIAQRNSDRLIRLINDLLDIQKLAVGKFKLRLKPIALSAFIKKAIEANQGFALTYGIDYLFSNQLDHELYIEGDEDRLLQVMANLLSNAAKFSPTGGIVTISTARGPRHTADIQVRDQGPGIPEAFHDDIFDKFSQADSYTTRTKGGTGLGLSICKSIIDLHNGHIGFQTGRKGTTFSFQIPLSPAIRECTSVYKNSKFLQQIPLY